MITNLIKKVFNFFGLQVTFFSKKYPLIKPIDVKGIEILNEKEFRKSCLQVKNFTILDTPRLANLWELCKMSNPKGNIIEIGTYKGGASLHLSNACPNRKIIVCDCFSKSFEHLNTSLDYSFKYSQFTDNRKQEVENLFIKNNKNYLLLDGFFPESVGNYEIGPVSFAYIDVDIYKATKDTLFFLQEKNCFIEKSLIVLDDYKRLADGVDKAVSEFSNKYPEWQPFPLFPGQCLLVNKSWF